MSRSIGDHQARRIGVIPTPEITETELGSDVALVIGSDGLFEYLTNYEITLFLHEERHKSPHDAAKAIVERARERWLSKQTRSDDITCVIAYLNQQ